MDLESLYLDYNATSPLSKSVKSWLERGEVLFANPSSQHSFGKKARKSINEARARLYSTFKLSEKDYHLFFHSGASEGISTFAYSFSEWARLTGKELLICYSRLDHPAVTGLAERYFGPHVKFYELQVDQQLAYDHAKNFAFIKDKKDNNPDLMILYHHLWVHNETGIVAPLEELIQFKNIADLYIHVDAVQTPGKIVNWQELKSGDIFTYSAHKFGALKGIGFSFFAKKIQFHPFITGGGQQQNQRSGTENPMGVHSVDLALQDLMLVNVSETQKRREELEAFLEKELNGIGGIISNKGKIRNSNTIYFYLTKLASDIALATFDVNGLSLSAGSACSSGAAKPAAILVHLGFKDNSRNGLRISFNPAITDEELAKIKTRFQSVIVKIRQNN